MSARIYLDWNATAPLRPEARAAMLSALDQAGNPSSVHAEGRAARAIVEKARAQVARLAGCQPPEVVFTASATEAAALAARQFPGHFLASDVEHDAVLAQRTGAVGSVDRNGIVALPTAAIGREAGSAIAVQAANGETGVIQPVAEIAASLVSYGVPCISDAVQLCGRAALGFAASGLAMALLSAHKIGGPKGVGALIVREGTDVAPLLPGGGQELGRRSGTENVAGIAGFGAAAEAALRDLDAGVWSRVEKLRNILEDRLEAGAADTIFVGRDAPRLPNTSCFAVPGWKGETQVMQLDLAGFAVSAGSACSSGKVRQSRVLMAMGYDDETAGSAIRVSLGPTTTEAEGEAFATAWTGLHARRRSRAA